MLGVAAWAQIPSLEKQFIFDLSKKKFDWLIRKDYDSLSFLLDDKIQYIHSNGWIQNKHEILDDLRTGKQYYFKSRNLSYRPLPPYQSDCNDPEALVSMDIIYPKTNSRIFPSV